MISSSSPRGTPHDLRRLTDEPVPLLTLVSPAGSWMFFEDVVRAAEQALLEDPERLAAPAADWGTFVLGDYPVLSTASPSG